MNVITRGVRNAFRNAIRTASIITILGLSIGLSLSMLLAHQAVAKKIKDAKAAVGNTITVSPAGFNPGSQANNALTTSELSKVDQISHVTNVTETLSDRLSTTGSAQSSFGRFGNSSSSGSTTSLKSPVKLDNSNAPNGGGGPRFFVNGGGSLPTDFSLPISFEGTTDPTQLDGTSITIKSGKAIGGSSDTNDVLISSSMASKNGLKVGSTFKAYDKTLTVAGIFSSSNRTAEGTVILSLPALQRLSGQSGVVTSAVATVDSLDNLSAATTAIKNAVGSSADVSSAQEQADNTIAPLNSVKAVSTFSLIGATVAGAVIILMTMIMIVRERRREIGVLKAIGASNPKVTGQFAAEAVTLTGLGALVGIVLGAIASNPITNMLVTNSSSSGTGTASRMAGPGGFGGGERAVRFAGGAARGVSRGLQNVHAAVGWDILLYGLGAALLIALVGSIFAAFFISKIRPAEAMRAE